MIDAKKIFDDNEELDLKFKDVKFSFSNRPDVYAFVLLDKIFPRYRCMICAAEHDQIWLDVDIADLNSVCTEEQVLDLIRCGVFYDDDMETLSMFV